MEVVDIEREAEVMDNLCKESSASQSRPLCLENRPKNGWVQDP